MNTQNPDDNRAWEAAMSRDFDARVRDLHEAPLDLTVVKGKARRIRRNRRAAVAGGVLGIAAVVTPVAVLAGGGDTQSREPDFAPNPSETVSDPSAGRPDYVVGREWHQADGDIVRLPENYEAAVLWEDNLVALRETNAEYTTADVLTADGEVVDSFESTRSVAVNDDHTTIAFVDPGGELRARWDGGEAVLASGLDGNDFPAALDGGPGCDPEAGDCVVYVNEGEGGCLQLGSTDSSLAALPGGPAVKCFDATAEGEVTVTTNVRDDLTACGGLFETGDLRLRWEDCDHQASDISPDGEHVVGIPSQTDATGPTSISILDAATGAETPGRFAPEGGFVGRWAWGADGRLLFDTYDGARWHLMALDADGTLEEVADPAAGDEFRSPFVLIQR